MGHTSGKECANGKEAMSGADILEELDQDETNNDIGADDLGGVCFFYLMLNRTFFELNTE